MTKFDEINSPNQPTNNQTSQQNQPSKMTMKSPFSLCSVPFDDVVPVFDPDACRRRHYCMFNMRISSCIEKTTSMPSKNSQNKQTPMRKLIHNDSVGTLMVEKRKPFVVRFKSDTV